MPTVTDILAELEKPGRDPRPAFKTATFREGVEKLEDLQPGMVLEGVVTNVASFGAFVDVGGFVDAPRRRAQFLALGGGGSVLALSLFLAWWMARAIRRPVEVLTAATKAVASGAPIGESGVSDR